MNISEHFKNLLQLSALEKKADHEQYTEKLNSTSFKQRRKEGICWYPVEVEQTKFDAGERLIVKIIRHKEHDEQHMFRSGKPVIFFSNNAGKIDDEYSVKGVVNRAGKQEMHITLNCDDVPDWIHDNKLGIQLMFDEGAYKEMDAALKYLGTTDDERIKELCNILLADMPARFREQHRYENKNLNENQNTAVQNVLDAEDVAIIHGPPGTGKTTTLIQAVMKSLQTEKQILVSAPSNAAVDLLVDKLTSEGIRVLRIGHPARVTQEQLDHTLDAHFSRHNDFKLLKSIRKQAEEYYAMARKYKRNFGAAERQQRKLLYAEVSKLRKEAEQLEFFIGNDCISKAQVIACTLVGAANHNLKGRKFSTVFIDEAAQGLEPAAWIPITKAHRVIFAGDHKQLPPTVKSIKAAKEGLAVTLFEKAIENNSADVMLTEQYRMHEDIMNFSSSLFYEGRLTAHPSVAKHLMFEDDNALEFIDTAGCGFFESTDQETRSSFNAEEAGLLITRLKNYLAELREQGETSADIGIISPYKAQVELLIRKVESEIDKEYQGNIAVNTVDSFQGQERDIIFISLVRSNEKGEIGFLSDTRRMNVAMTRARKKLVIIGDSATVTAHEFYNAFLDYINELGAYRSAFEFLY